MSDRAPELELPQAAEILRLPPSGVEALVGAGYLKASAPGPSGPRFALRDIKAFLARNDDDGTGDLFAETNDATDPQALLDALDGRSEEMARRAFDIFTAAVPEAATWNMTEEARFVDQAKKRFEAILAITGQGEEVDEALVDDLQDVGAAAAWAGSPLPQLLVVLRISRDLMVQTAVEVAEERGRHWGLALSLLLTRVLPAMDRLTDALAQGYWAAVVGREEESRGRYQNLVEHSSDGIYEIDLDGTVQYANPSMAVIVGVPVEELEGERIDDVIAARGTNLADRLTVDPDTASARLEVTITRGDGVTRVLDIRTLARREEGVIVGYQGVVRDVTAANELDAAKNEFLALITHDLRNPLTTILGLGVTLETYAEELSVERLKRMGSSVRRQSERISRLADDLFDVSRLEAKSLLLNLRPVDVAVAVEAALAGLEDADAVVVRVPDGLSAMADARRLEQVLANLVENALTHGNAPVVVEAHAIDGARPGVEISVRDHGPGVPAAVVPTLFSRLESFGRRDRDRTAGTGLGLSLVRGLVEAMGGRVSYETGDSDGGGAVFRLLLASPSAS